MISGTRGILFPNFFDFSREARLNLKRMKYDSPGERIEKWEFTRMVNSHFMGG